MTPQQGYELDQQQRETEDAIAQEMRLNGLTDGAFGYMPQYLDPDYLFGYCEGIRQLPHDGNGKILYCQPIPNYDSNPF